MDAPDTSSGPIRGYEDLLVYQRGIALLKPLHKLVLEFPDYEKYDLASQIRRASKSVPANIAEGYAKKRSAKEFKSYLTTAMGSASEVVVHLKIARELEYANEGLLASFIDGYDVLGRQLNRLISRWRTLDGQATNGSHPTSNLQPPGDQSNAL